MLRADGLADIMPISFCESGPFVEAIFYREARLSMENDENRCVAIGGEGTERGKAQHPAPGCLPS